MCPKMKEEEWGDGRQGAGKGGRGGGLWGMGVRIANKTVCNWPK